jgi:hypothetical protein
VPQADRGSAVHTTGAEKIWIRKPEQKNMLDDSGLDRRIILKHDLKQDGRV